MRRSLNAEATSTPVMRRRWAIATTSEITVRFFPGLSGTITLGMVTSRMVVSWRTSPVRSASLVFSQSSSCTTTSIRFCWRTERMPKSAFTSIRPIPRISMWCAASSWPCPIRMSFPFRATRTMSSAPRGGPPPHRVEPALALADSRAPGEEQPPPVDVGERAVERGALREGVLEDRLDPAVELGRLEPRPEHRNAAVPGQREQQLGHFLPLGDEDAGEVVAQERFQRVAPRLLVEGVEKGDLGFAEHVHPGRHEATGIAGEHQPRAGRILIGEPAVEADLPGERLQLEGIAMAGEEGARAGGQ